jgi:hypothetical protein
MFHYYFSEPEIFVSMIFSWAWHLNSI